MDDQPNRQGQDLGSCEIIRLEPPNNEWTQIRIGKKSWFYYNNKPWQEPEEAALYHYDIKGTSFICRIRDLREETTCDRCGEQVPHIVRFFVKVLLT
jgi:hypothetical protein